MKNAFFRATDITWSHKGPSLHVEPTSVAELSKKERSARMHHSSVPGDGQAPPRILQSGQSPDLDPGPALLESFLESRVVGGVVARSLYYCRRPCPSLSCVARAGG